LPATAGVSVNTLRRDPTSMSSTADTETDPDPEPDAEVVKVTETAAEQALGLLEGEEMDTDVAGLRLFVQQGGCAGLSYGMRFDYEPEDDDRVFERHGLRVFVDPASMNYIEGSVLDFEGGLQGAGFHVENPNVVSECGCGESFRT
jgi:iron-sulfur cluster assembly protein